MSAIRRRLVVFGVVLAGLASSERLAAAPPTQAPAERPRPFVLPTSFQEEQAIKDVLGLGKRVDDLLRAASSRGGEETFMFLDARDLPDAFSLAGRYTLEDGTVRVNARLFEGGHQRGVLTATGDKSDLDDLAARIAKFIEERLAAEE